MTHNQRLKEILKSEKFNAAKFCRVINYTPKNLGNYLNGETAYPHGKLIMGILKHFPYWNIRYWLLGEGKPLLGEDTVKIIHETIEDYRLESEVVKELMEQLAYLRKENEQKEETLKRLKQ